ncbi:MAG: hypothetical protein AAFV71_25730 [Cyanobacteria bacterium J06633_8]
MKSVVLTSAILTFTALVYIPEVSASSINYYASDSVIERNINQVERDKPSLMPEALHNTSIPRKCSHDTNTSYQLTSGDFLLYFLFTLICLLLLFQVWLDYNFSGTKKHY